MMGWLCGLLHTKRVRSFAGTGTYRCGECGQPFANASEAGILKLDDYERQLSLDRVVRLEDEPERTVEFVPRAFRLFKGNKLVKEEKLA